METKQLKEQPARPNSPAPRPQLTVRCGLRAGRNDACALGVGYWRKELNNLKTIANVLDCD
jgi:hypothetical protein